MYISRQFFDISITRKEIFDAVELNSGYSAVRSGESDADPLRSQATGADMALLNGYFDEAVGSLLSLIRTFLTGVVNTNMLTLSFSMPADFDILLRNPLRGAIMSYLKHSLLMQWSRIMHPGVSATHEMHLRRDTDTLLSLLYHRPAPRRRTLSPA